VVDVAATPERCHENDMEAARLKAVHEARVEIVPTV
jgi:hypothetical protein